MASKCRWGRRPQHHERKLVRLDDAEHWSLTTLREKLVKYGVRNMRHDRCVALQFSQVTEPRAVFAEILHRMDRLRPRPPPLPA